MPIITDPCIASIPLNFAYPFSSSTKSTEHQVLICIVHKNLIYRRLCSSSIGGSTDYSQRRFSLFRRQCGFPCALPSHTFHGSYFAGDCGAFLLPHSSGDVVRPLLPQQAAAMGNRACETHTSSVLAYRISLLHIIIEDESVSTTLGLRLGAAGGCAHPISCEFPRH